MAKALYLSYYHSVTRLLTSTLVPLDRVAYTAEHKHQEDDKDRGLYSDK